MTLEMQGPDLALFPVWPVGALEEGVPPDGT